MKKEKLPPKQSRRAKRAGSRVVKVALHDSAQSGPAGKTPMRDDQLFLGLFDEAAIPASVQTLDGRFLRVNRAYCRMVGYPEHELRRMTFRDLTHPDDREAADAIPMRKLISGELPGYQLEKRYLHKDGRTIWAESSVTLLRDPHGWPRCFFVQTQDITLRREAEAALLISEERLRLALDGGRMGIWETDLEAQKTIATTRNFELFGLSPCAKPVDRKVFYRRIHPEDVKMVRDVSAAALKNGGEFACEYRVVWPDGSMHWLASRGSFSGGEPGRPAKMAGVTWDITEHKQAVEALRHGEELLWQGVRAAGLGLFDHNHKAETLYLSPLIRDIHGWDRDADVSLEDVINCVHPEDRPAFVAAIRRAHDPSRNGLFSTDHRIVWPDGAIRWVSTRSLTTFEGRGRRRRPARTVGATVDITARKEAEEELRRARDEMERRVIGRTAELADANKSLRERTVELETANKELRTLTVELARTNERLHAEMAERAHLQEMIHAAGERERERIGHDLHDGLCQTLTAIRFRSEILAHQMVTTPPPDVAGEAGTIASLLAEATAQARDLVRGLQPVDPLPEGLSFALRQLAARSSEIFGIDCRCIIQGEGLAFGHSVATDLFRIAQEAVTNAVKHGQAGAIHIRLSRLGRRATLSISSDGRRMPRHAPSTGIGLKTMRYRADRAGAKIEIGPGPSGGALIRCTVALLGAKNRRGAASSGL